MRKPAVPDRPAGRSDEDSLAYELVAALTEQEILKRFYLDEQSAVEICAVMGITETQFRLIKSRLVARIVELSRMVPVQRDTRARTVTTRATRAKGATADIGRLVPVVAHAVAVFGDEHKASHWLATPLALLGNQSPAHVLARSGGVEAVDRILTRIEHNIPS
jgi:putative toxin-antitoxin system antitoxin component (TIGR02293 family)